MAVGIPVQTGTNKTEKQIVTGHPQTTAVMILLMMLMRTLYRSFINLPPHHILQRLPIPNPNERLDPRHKFSSLSQHCDPSLASILL